MNNNFNSNNNFTPNNITATNYNSRNNNNGNEMRFAADAPYPSVQVTHQDPELGAQILDNVGGSNSEISTIALYIYNHYITNDEFKSVGEIFRQIAMVEMHHLDIFSGLSLALGMEPRLWTRQNNRFQYWTPSYVNYALDLKTMVLRALNGELAAIEKYEKQIDSTDDNYIIANLQRVILDEELHVEIFRQLIDTYQL